MDLSTTHNTDTRPKNYSGLSKRSCPDCTARLVRIARRPVDRLQSLLVPVKRYSCRTFMCGWEGNLPWSAGTQPVASGAVNDGNARSESGFDRTPLLIAVSFALIASAIVLVFLLASTGAEAASRTAGADPSGARPAVFAGTTQPGAAHEPPAQAGVWPLQVASAVQ